MQEKRIFLDRLFNKKRVEITPKNYLKQIKLISVAVAIFSLVAAGLVVFIGGITMTNLIIAGGIILISFLIIRNMRKRLKAVAVKGDTIILNAIGRMSCVTSVRSINNVQSNTFFGIQRVTFQYKLDGVNRTGVFMHFCSAFRVHPQLALNKAISRSKKQKANHKPGSVSA